MSKKSYSYEDRIDVLPISWDDFHSLCKGLAMAVAPFAPEIILAVGRGGFYPGTLISHILQAEIYPVRISRRFRDVVKYDSPEWLVRPPEVVKGRRVLIVDEICDSGETLAIVRAEVKNMGANQVKCAVLYAHVRSVAIPNYIGLITDALILNPWDREIWQDGAFQFHPEYVAALAAQGLTPDSSLQIRVNPIKIAKG